jgi:hypothetical protein
MDTPQLEGNIHFTTVDPTTGLIEDDGWVDFSEEVSSLVFKSARDSIAKPASFANARKVTKSGALEYSCVINLMHDESDSLGLHKFLWDAIEAGLEVGARASFKPGAVSATNPGFTGILAIVGLDTGGTVNEWKQQGQTYPARDVERGVTPWAALES